MKKIFCIDLSAHGRLYSLPTCSMYLVVLGYHGRLYSLLYHRTYCPAVAPGYRVPLHGRYSLITPCAQLFFFFLVKIFPDCIIIFDPYPPGPPSLPPHIICKALHTYKPSAYQPRALHISAMPDLISPPLSWCLPIFRWLSLPRSVGGAAPHYTRLEPSYAFYGPVWYSTSPATSGLPLLPSLCPFSTGLVFDLYTH